MLLKICSDERHERQGGGGTRSEGEKGKITPYVTSVLHVDRIKSINCVYKLHNPSYVPIKRLV